MKIGIFASLVLAGLVATGVPASAQSADANDRLNRTIHQAMRADGPFFTPSEQAVINAKCGYRAGEWDGHDVNINNGVLTCKNGKRVDDAEMRALLAKAMPRIERRVEAVMARADVKAAIGRVAEEATAEALRKVRVKRGR